MPNNADLQPDVAARRSLPRICFIWTPSTANPCRQKLSSRKKCSGSVQKHGQLSYNIMYNFKSSSGSIIDRFSYRRTCSSQGISASSITKKNCKYTNHDRQPQLHSPYGCALPARAHKRAIDHGNERKRNASISLGFEGVRKTC